MQGGSGGGDKEGGGKSDGGRKDRKSKTSGTVSTTGVTSISPLGEGGSLITETILAGGRSDVGGNALSSSSGAVTGLEPSSHSANGHHTTTTTTTSTTAVGSTG